MKRLLQAFRSFVAEYVVSDDPTDELSRLDKEDAAAHGRYMLEGLY